MSELIQQLSVPAKTTFARNFPGSDRWSDEPFLIKFGDFEVQVMDKDMKTFNVFLDDQLFVDGKLVEGSPGDSVTSNKNNHHSVTVDEPLLSATTFDGYSFDQGQNPGKNAQSPDVVTANDLRKSVSLCNQTIADLVDKKLLKFTKSKRGLLKKQTTTFSREREEVLETLHRLSEQSRQVVQNEDNMKRQLEIEQRNQVILERIIRSFGKELQATSSQILELKNQLESTNIQYQSLKETIKKNNSGWEGKLMQKDKECQMIRKEKEAMAQFVKEKDQTVYDVTNELTKAKRLVKSLEAASEDWKSKNTVLQDVIDKEAALRQTVVKVKERLCNEKKSLESGLKVMEARMKEQRKFFEEQMNLMKEDYEMEVIKMKKMMDAEMMKRDGVLQDLRCQLTEEQNWHEALKGEIAVVRSDMREEQKQNEALKKEMKLIQKSLDLVTDEKAKLVASHQEQENHIQNEIKILKEKLMDEQRRRVIAEDLHQRMVVTKNAEEERFMARQVELFLTSCTDNAVLLNDTKQMQKKHLELAAEANRRCTHLQENNKQLQKKMREAHERYCILHRDFEKLQNRLFDAEKKISYRGGQKGLPLISATKQVLSPPRVKELESELVQKTQEQDDMRVLIRWLKKDISKAETDLAQMTSEKQDLIASMEKERSQHERVVNDLKKTIAEEKLVRKNVCEMRDSKNRRLAKKMTGLHLQLKVHYNDLQKSKAEADEEVKRLKTRVSELEDELDKMDEELENREQDIEDLEDDLDDAEYEIKQQEKQMKKLQNQVGGLLKTKKKLENKLRNFQSRA